MKIKTSITLSEDLIQDIDQFIGESRNRSAFIEMAVRSYLDSRSKSLRDLRDLEIINKNAERLKREAEDVLAYQVEL
jgi:metal-responsive CopG/Arc/MetJ family transcriptional regulator